MSERLTGFAGIGIGIGIFFFFFFDGVYAHVPTFFRMFFQRLFESD